MMAGRRRRASFASMRLLLAFLCLAAPARAWEFSASPVCTLAHAEGAAEMRVTHDPRLAEPYAIDVTGPAVWPEGPVFGIDFAGPRPLSIATGRHSLSSGGRTVTVTDRGFGNVLNGLEFNDTAIARLASASVSFSLEGIAEPMAAFRACLAAPVA